MIPHTNVTNPNDNIGPNLAAVCITLLAISGLVVGSRVLGRALLTLKIGWDDASMVAALLAALSFDVLVLLDVQQGIGRHALSLPPGNTAGRWGAAAQLSYNFSLTFSKTSVLLQILRILPVSSCRARHYCWAMFGVNTVCSIGTVAATLVLQCFVTLSRQKGKGCVKGFPWVQVGIAALGAATDLGVWIAPVRLVAKVRLPKVQKAGLVACFAVGALAWVAGILRLVSSVIEAQDSYLVIDYTYRVVPVAICAAVEIHVAIICGSIPALHPILRRIFPINADDPLRRELPHLSEIVLSSYHETPARAGQGEVFVAERVGSSKKVNENSGSTSTSHLV